MYLTEFTFPFYLTRVIDADTLVGDIDLGFKITLFDQRIRLYGVDAPEIRGPEKEEGLIAKNFVENILKEFSLYIVSHNYDSFGRILAEVLLVEEASKSTIDLSTLLLDLDFVKPYT